MSAKLSVLNIDSGLKQPPILLRRGRVTLGFDKRSGVKELQHDPAKYRLEVIYDGHNMIVIDRGSPAIASIGGEALGLEAPHIWLEDQELRISNTYVILWEDERRAARKEKDERGIARRSPRNFSLSFAPQSWRSSIATLFQRRIGARVQFLSPMLTILFFLLLFGLLGWLLMITLAQGRKSLMAVATPTLAVTVTTSVTSVQTETVQATAMLPSLALAPAAAHIQPIDNTPPTAVVETGALTTPTPAPCQAPPWGARVWDQRLDELGGIEFISACVRPGETYWRLVAARWYDAVESQGYHHIFIDLLDEDGNRMLEPTVSAVASWPNGRCQPPLEDRLEPVVHSLQCAMFTPGAAYNVYVQGLPSDSVRGLGLGSIEHRDWGVLTSFYLQFQRTMFTADVSPP